MAQLQVDIENDNVALIWDKTHDMLFRAETPDGLWKNTQSKWTLTNITEGRVISGNFFSLDAVTEFLRND